MHTSTFKATSEYIAKKATKIAKKNKDHSKEQTKYSSNSNSK